MSQKRNKVGHNESAGGPDDQERWQKAESLHEPKHLGELFKRQKTNTAPPPAVTRVFAVQYPYDNQMLVQEQV